MSDDCPPPPSQSSMQPPPPPSHPPPTPVADTRQAIDDLQRAGAAASSTPSTTLPSGSLLFPQSVNRPTTEPAETPSQTASQQPSSRKKKTPSSASSAASTVAVNRNGCINSFLFSEFREAFVSSSADFVDNDKKFEKFKNRFTHQTNHRFALTYQTAAVLEQELDSQPRTRSEARALLQSTDFEAERLQTNDVGGIVACEEVEYMLTRRLLVLIRYLECHGDVPLLKVPWRRPNLMTLC